jgi:DNA-directed RNA polymerase specialized sigma24 family protein
LGIHAHFWESPEARIALDDFMAGDDDEPVAFWHKVFELVDKGAELRALLAHNHLTLEELEELRQQVANRRAATTGGPQASEVRNAVRVMLLHAFTPKQTAALLGIDEGDVSAHKKRTRTRAESPAILELHRKGVPYVDIARQLEVPRITVFNTLQSIGETPIRKNNHTSPELAKQIAELRNEGLSHASIAARLGCTIDQVRGALKKKVAS